MTISILATGKLTGEPETKISQSGKPFCKFRLSAHDGEQTSLVSCVAFSETAIDAVQRLGKGDTIAVTGRGKPTAWQKDGVTHSGLDVVVDAVLSLYQVTKKRGKSNAPASSGKYHHGPQNAATAYRAAAMAQRAGGDMADNLPW